MITIEHIIQSLDNAEKLQSKLPTIIAEEMEGMSSRKIRHFLNNLCSIRGLKYLNLGLAAGSTFWSAIFNNNIKATGIDHWRGLHSSKETESIFFKLLSQTISFEKEPLDRILEICNYDGNNIILNDKYDVFFYDGDHSFEGQYRTLIKYDRYLKDKFVIIIDDFNDQGVISSAEKAFQEMKYKCHFGIIKYGEFGNWDIKSDGWWNSIYIGLMEKTRSS